MFTKEDYENAPIIECACGCGEFRKKYDVNGIERKYIKGHWNKYRDREVWGRLDPRQKSWDNMYERASIIECACGCGEKLKSKDHYGRDRKFINGHNNRKYNDLKQCKKEWKKKNHYRNKAVNTIRCLDHKAKLLESFGGKCYRCGYTYNGENGAAFDFHHREPSEKEFGVNAGAFNRYSVSRIYEEVKKCDILCSNCHRILHSRAH